MIKVKSFSSLEYKHQMFLVSGVILLLAATFVLFGETLWRDSKQIFDNVSYAPHFDLEKVSGGAWTLEKRENEKNKNQN